LFQGVSAPDGAEEDLIMKPGISQLMAVLFAALSLAGCGGSSSPAMGTLGVSMTDAPACGFDHVYVTVDRVRVNQSATAGDQDGGWSEVRLSPAQKIDLLGLSNGVLMSLGQTPLPAGHYEQIRLVLVANQGNTLSNSIVPTGGTEQALSTPSASQSGYKVIGSFDVHANTLVDLVLDFDACHSIVQRGNGSYGLKPVVKATPEIVSGAIVGFVDPSEAGASVYAEQNGTVIKGTVADSTGRFVLAPVLQSSSNGTYDVVIVQNDHATGVVRAVPVVAATDTTVSTAASPFLLPTSVMHVVSGTVSPASAEAVIDALQTSGGGSYTVVSVNANLDTGVYALSLPAGAPLTGTYGTPLPIVLTADASVAGQYNIRATSVGGITQSSAVSVASSDVGSVNFAF
jgi:hypothetical protein